MEEGREREKDAEKKTISIKYNENSGFVDSEFMCIYYTVAPTADNVVYVCHASLCVVCGVEKKSASFELHPDCFLLLLLPVPDKYRYM